MSEAKTTYTIDYETDTYAGFCIEAIEVVDWVAIDKMLNTQNKT